MQKSDKIRLSILASNRSVEDTRTNQFTDDEAKNFYVTFCKFILDKSQKKEITTQEDAIYKSVLSYFANGLTDDTAKQLNLILGSTYIGDQIQSTRQYKCCNQALVSSDSSNMTCSSLYDSAMKQYMIQMLGNTDFYWNWFFVHNNEGDSVKKVLVNSLIRLINQFLNLNIDLSFNENKYNCSYDYESDSKHIENVKIIENYKTLLSWLLVDCGLSNNKNKIKLFGNRFGSLLPKLRFV